PDTEGRRWRGKVSDRTPRSRRDGGGPAARPRGAQRPRGPRPGARDPGARGRDAVAIAQQDRGSIRCEHPRARLARPAIDPLRLALPTEPPVPVRPRAGGAGTLGADPAGDSSRRRGARALRRPPPRRRPPDPGPASVPGGPPADPRADGAGLLHLLARTAEIRLPGDHVVALFGAPRGTLRHRGAYRREPPPAAGGDDTSGDPAPLPDRSRRLDRAVPARRVLR